MAATSTKPKLKPDENRNDGGGIMQFVGPAQKFFGSFVELARFTMDTYWLNWNNPFNPNSYISPQTFTFKNPDKSDLDIDGKKNDFEQTRQLSCVSQQELGSLERPITDRRSDYGEFVVFQALWKLVQENVQAPFLAIRGLDLAKMQWYLQQIFPSAQSDIQVKFKEMMREFDFVLIGPKIGVIVIEVKSSAFKNKKDFAAKSRSLPAPIVDALHQLNSFDVQFLKDCSGLKNSSPVIPLRKILFTSNLEKNRLEDWYGNLGQSGMDKVDNVLSGVTHWLGMDDMANVCRDSLKPLLYSSLRQVIEADGFQLPVDVYELFGPIVVGLGSAWVIKSHQRKIELLTHHISSSTAILNHAAVLESQEPLDIIYFEPGAKRRKIDETPKLILSSKMVLLTPEQRIALNDQNYQFIVGGAGTGKTIILQAKAMEMLTKEKQVLVFATPNFCRRYSKLFDDHGLKNYETRPIPILRSRICSSLDQELESVMKDLENPASKILDHLVSLSDKKAMQQLLSDVLSITEFDAIFIDDAIDKAEEGSIDGDNVSFLCALFAAMATGKLYWGSKMLWVAMDPFFLNPEPSVLMHKPFWQIAFYRRILAQMTQLETGSFSYSCLRQVMRCSESVFQSTYRLEVLGQMAVKPLIGHKIHGFSDIVSLNFSTNSAGPSFFRRTRDTQFQQHSLVWKHIKNILVRFHGQEGFDYGQMAIITGSLGHDYGDVLAHFISNKCREDGIPIIDDVEEFSSEAADGKLVISSWRSVSSQEWPVVVYVFEVGKKNQDNEHFVRRNLLSEDYLQYRACSRATMRLSQVIVHYNMRKRSWEADICNGKSGPYTMAPIEEKTKEDIHVSNMSETTDQLAIYTTRRNQGGQNLFWKQTIRRSFSIHNLDLSTISVESESFKSERRNIEGLLNFPIKSRLDSALRSAEEFALSNAMDGVSMMDEEMECTDYTAPMPSQQSDDRLYSAEELGQLIVEIYLRLPEKTRMIFKDFWVEQLSCWNEDDRSDILKYEASLDKLTMDFLSPCGEELRYWQTLIIQFCALVKDDRLFWDL